MNEQGDIGMYQQPLDLQASNTGVQHQASNTGMLHSYISNYNPQPLGQTSPNRSYMSSNMADQYHTNSSMTAYKSSYVSPPKVSHAVSGNEQYNLNTLTAQDYSQKELSSNTPIMTYKCSTSMTAKPPKSYTARATEFGSGIPAFRNNMAESAHVTMPISQDPPPPVKNPDPLPAMKTTPYKPRHNISEKVMRMETEPPPQITEDKLATQDYTETNLPRELMSKMFGLLKQGMFCDAVLVTGGKEIKVQSRKYHIT
jgi:hypothetical protein